MGAPPAPNSAGRRGQGWGGAASHTTGWASGDLRPGARIRAGGSHDCYKHQPGLGLAVACFSTGQGQAPFCKVHRPPGGHRLAALHNAPACNSNGWGGQGGAGNKATLLPKGTPSQELCMQPHLALRLQVALGDTPLATELHGPSVPRAPWEASLGVWLGWVPRPPISSLQGVVGRQP